MTKEKVLKDFWQHHLIKDTSDNSNLKPKFKDPQKVFVNWAMKSKIQQNNELKTWLNDVRIPKMDTVIANVTSSLEEEENEDIITLKLAQIEKCRNWKKQYQQFHDTL